MYKDKPPEPWFSFLRDIDAFLTEETDFHCLGGFVVTVVYGSVRSTADLDAIATVQKDPRLLAYAGQGSPLHRKHKVYLDPVGVAPLPEDYEDRLTEIFPGLFKRLRLFALDPYDIALTKIERNTERDRDDVKHLARVAPFDLEILKQRYYDELRVYLGNPEREDLTLKLWVEMIEENELGGL
jgi:hypothetical protein